jgi:hypothetical protein
MNVYKDAEAVSKTVFKKKNVETEMLKYILSFYKPLTIHTFFSFMPARAQNVPLSAFSFTQV